MDPDTTDPWNEWRATWRPVRRPGAREDDTDLLAFTFDPHRPEHAEAIRALGGKWCEHLWTLKDAGGMALAISAGHSIVDRMGYLLTERAHEGFEATPVLMLGDPDICVVPDEMTDEELREALEEYEEEAAEAGDRGEVGRRNLGLLITERARRWGR